jgi:hypothetical protein
LNELLLTAGDRLQLRFARRGDRWEHIVEFRTDGKLAWRLNSIEGTPDNDWPSSPAFQSLAMHAGPEGRKFALLVGMAGASHWSASIEADPAAERIVFDIACRIKQEPKWLGSSYLAWPSDGKESRLVIEPAGPQSTSDISRPVIEVEANQIRICVPHRIDPLPRTVRWKYSIPASPESV